MGLPWRPWELGPEATFPNRAPWPAVAEAARPTGKVSGWEELPARD